MWSSLLNIEKVSIHDNFFNLGGSSLILVALVANIKEILNKSISMTSLFKHPTIFEISKLLDADNIEVPKDFVFTIQEDGEKPPLFLIHTDDGLAFEYTALSQYLSNQPYLWHK